MSEASLRPFWGRIIWIFSLQQQSRLSLLALFNNIGSFKIIVRETHAHVLLIWSHNVCTMCSLLMGSVVIHCSVFWKIPDISTDQRSLHYRLSAHECTRFAFIFANVVRDPVYWIKILSPMTPYTPKLDEEDGRKIECSSEMTRDSFDKLYLH